MTSARNRAWTWKLRILPAAAEYVAAPAVHSGENAIGLSVFCHQVDKSFRKGLVPAASFVEFGNLIAIAGIHILAEHFPTGMALPGVGRIAAG
jgi:hypothetical protein